MTRIRLSLAVLFFLACSENSKTPTGSNENHKRSWGRSEACRDKDRDSDTLKIASLNLAIGFDVTQLLFIDQSDSDVVYETAVKLHEEFSSNRAAERVKHIASTIKQEAPDVIGLQETMTLYESDTLLADFVAELMSELAPMGYSVFKTPLTELRVNPVATDGRSIDLLFTEGNAVFYRSKHAILDSSSHVFANLISGTMLGKPFTVQRALNSVQLQTEKGRRVWLHNTHLEIGLLPLYNPSQASEALQVMQTRYVDGDIAFFLGDMNVIPSPANGGVYGSILEDGYVDLAIETGNPGEATCCVPELTNAHAGWNPLGFTGASGRRIDFVFGKGGCEVISADVLLGAPFTLGTDSLFASDHGMVIVNVVLP